MAQRLADATTTSLALAAHKGLLPRLIEIEAVRRVLNAYAARREAR